MIDPAWHEVAAKRCGEFMQSLKRSANDWSPKTRAIAPFFACSLAACASISEQQTTCAREEIIASVERMESLLHPPELKVGERSGALYAVSIFEPNLGDDFIKYTAIVDNQSKQVWLYSYGGFGGQVDWYGPLTVPLASVAGCPAATVPR
jgi:hypothetical protein